MSNFLELDIIHKKAKFYAKELWDVDFDIPIVFNKRLKRTSAQFYKNKIELGTIVYLMNELEFDDLLLHEMCHWYCEKIGKPDNDHDYYFEMELLNIGASSTERTELKGEELIYWNPYLLFKCLECGSESEISPYDIDDPHNTNWSWQTECCGRLRNTRGRSYKKGKFEPNKKLFKLNNKFKLHADDKLLVGE